jgi:hypothetical protein
VPPARSGKDGEQRDPRLRRFRADHVDRLFDLPLFESCRHPDIVMPGLDDHQRRLDRAKVDPSEFRGHRAFLACAAIYIAGAGHPVHDSVPAQHARQQHRP